MRRYLIVSDEWKGAFETPVMKLRHTTHFDIVPARNIDHAIDKVKKARPKVFQFTHLSKAEIDSIYHAMSQKSDLHLQAKFEENTKCNKK